MTSSINALDEAALKRVKARTVGLSLDLIEFVIQAYLSEANGYPTQPAPARTDRFADGVVRRAMVSLQELVDYAGKDLEGEGEDMRMGLRADLAAAKAVIAEIRALSSHSGESKEEGRPDAQ